MNLRFLKGRPLVCYPIHAALENAQIAEVVMISDDATILDHASQFPVVRRERP